MKKNKRERGNTENGWVKVKRQSLNWYFNLITVPQVERYTIYNDVKQVTNIQKTKKETI